MAKDLNFSLSERILRNANQKFSDCTKPPVFVFDSTEKCAGTTLKRYLRANFSQDAFFDVDNGDPPSEKIRNYGIQCPVHFSPYGDFLDVRETNFYDIFTLYVRDRVKWLEAHLPQVSIGCVYGNMVHFTRLVSILEKNYDVRLCKFFRNPVRRVISEYHYVLQNKGHNLNLIARDSGCLENYIRHPERPKNRQVSSVLGKFNGGAGAAIERLSNEYFFIGLVESFDQHLEKFADSAFLDRPRSERHNVGQTDVYGEVLNQETDLCKLVYDSDLEDVGLYKRISGFNMDFTTPDEISAAV